MEKKPHEAAGLAIDRSLITVMKRAKAMREPAEAPFMTVIRLRSEPASAAAEGDFFFMGPKPVPV